MFLKFAATVTMIVRGPALELKMSQYLVDQILGRENIEVLVNTSVVEVTGDEGIATIKLANLADDTQDERAANAIFVFVGAVPHSDFVDGVVARNDGGFILTGPDAWIDGQEAHHLDDRSRPDVERDERPWDFRCRRRAPRGGATRCVGRRPGVGDGQHDPQVSRVGVASR